MPGNRRRLRKTPPACRRNRAAVAASEAYKAGDLDRAGELTEQAAALDPSRAGLWQQHRNDIAARRLIIAARAAHAGGDHERAGKLLEDARQLDPRLRTLWDGSLPAQPASPLGPIRPRARQHRPGSTRHRRYRPPGATAQPARGHRSRHGRPRRSGESPDRAGTAAQHDPPGRSPQCSVLLTGQARANRRQRHRPARRTLTRTAGDDAARWPSPSPRSQPPGSGPAPGG